MRGNSEHVADGLTTCKVTRLGLDVVEKNELEF